MGRSGASAVGNESIDLHRSHAAAAVFVGGLFLAF